MPFFATVKNLYETAKQKLTTQPQHLDDRPTTKLSRKPKNFSDNFTPSLSMPDRPKAKYFKDNCGKSLLFATTKKIPERMLELQQEIKNNPNANLDDLELQRVEELWEQIITHAMMRSKLFFYLLVAVYGMKVTMNKDFTVKQHGRGSEAANTNACHDSLFASTRIESTPSIWIPKIISDFFGSKPMSLIGTHFGELLNNTTELSRLVNEFDMHLEGKVTDPSNTVRHLINIVNKVSHNHMDPRAGMDAYYQEMKLFFNEFETKNQLNIGAKTPRAMARIAELQKLGTFEGANEEQNAMSDNYFNLLMGFTSSEITQIRIQKAIHGWVIDPDVLATRYLKLQTEIHTKPPIGKKNKQNQTTYNSNHSQAEKNTAPTVALKK